MPGIDVNQLWTPARAIPSPQSDQKAPVTNVRGGRYGEQYVLPLISTKHLLADEGSYFIATNPTPGAALAYNVQAAFSDTVPLLYIQNNDSKANPLGKRMYLDYIKLICSVAPASSTGARFAVKTDRRCAPSPPTTRPQSRRPRRTQIWLHSRSVRSTRKAARPHRRCRRPRRRLAWSPMPAWAASRWWAMNSSWSVARSSRRVPGPDGGSATCAGRKVSCLPPIVLGPNSALTLYAWFPGNAATGLSCEFEVGWWGR